MKDEIKENNSVMKCCICNNENIGEFIVIEDKKYHLNCITNLQEENERLANELNNCMIERNNFLSRNEKAIEYIINCPEYLWSNVNTKVLLNILKGSE